MITSILLFLFNFEIFANPVVLEGKFGKVLIDTDKPALTELYLRATDGSLEPKSLLSPTDRPWLRDVPNWGTQAYTYVIGSDGTRYESRNLAPKSVVQSKGKVEIRGVKLVSKDNSTPLAIEDWTLEAIGNELKWTVKRTWNTSFKARLTATPALFFSNRPYFPGEPGKTLILENCVSTTVWFEPVKIKASYDSTYRSFSSMNGGSFPSQTYWEIMARARCGDAAGAYNRLKMFADGATRTSYMGNNWLDIKGNIGYSACDEPYLSDMIAVVGSLNNGIMGITPSWDTLVVNPVLPIGWDKVSADIVYKGFRHHISIVKGKVSDKKMERVSESIVPLEWEIRPLPNPKWNMRVARYWDTDDTWKLEEGCDIQEGQMLTLKQVNPKSNSAHYADKGGYITSACQWGGSANQIELVADTRIPGGAAIAIIELSDDSFKTIKVSEEVILSDGLHTYQPNRVQGVHKDVRIRFKLRSALGGKTAPQVFGVKLKVQPI